MASYTAATSTYRASSRFFVRHIRRNTVFREFQTASVCRIAQNFTMPALSPTMTEGNIASWRVKEGDSFSAGDVLLEIETDKASMDVEAQDDGIMAKILASDGSKGIKVGARIGVIAEAGDDLNSLEIPAEDNTPAKTEKSSSTTDKSKNDGESTSEKVSKQIPVANPGRPQKQNYPLLPSVEYLVHQNGLDTSEVDKIIPTGPNNRLLKGDVLAYLGKISASIPAELEAQFKHLSHLDLSNIKLASPQTSKPSSVVDARPEEDSQAESRIDLEVAVPISMAAVLQIQKRVQNSLGIHLPLSTFIARAADFANDNLPSPLIATQSSADLFDAILGLDPPLSSSNNLKGHFVPQIIAMPESALNIASKIPTRIEREVDIIDLLTGAKSRFSRKHNPATRTNVSMVASTNVLSLRVPSVEEGRARIFLERMKSALEEEPGRLIL